jgi:hypothetical protein
LTPQIQYSRVLDIGSERPRETEMTTVYGLRVKLNGQWGNSTRSFFDPEKADAFVARMNRAGLPAQRTTLGSAATTYVDSPVWQAHPERPDVDDAITEAIIATRCPSAVASISAV